MAEDLFKTPLSYYYQNIREEIDSVVGKTRCDEVGSLNAAEILGELTAPKIEFNSVPSSRRRVGEGAGATGEYIHSIVGADMFHFAPTSTVVLPRSGFKLSLVQKSLTFYIDAHDMDAERVKKLHEQIVNAIADNIRRLSNEVNTFHAGLKQYVEQAIKRRKEGCNKQREFDAKL